MGWFYIVLAIICGIISAWSTWYIKNSLKSYHIHFIIMSIAGYMLIVMCIINAIGCFTGRIV